MMMPIVCKSRVESITSESDPANLCGSVRLRIYATLILGTCFSSFLLPRRTRGSAAVSPTWPSGRRCRPAGSGQSRYPGSKPETQLNASVAAFFGRLRICQIPETNSTLAPAVIVPI